MGKKKDRISIIPDLWYPPRYLVLTRSLDPYIADEENRPRGYSARSLDETAHASETVKITMLGCVEFKAAEPPKSRVPNTHHRERAS